MALRQLSHHRYRRLLPLAAVVLIASSPALVACGDGNGDRLESSGINDRAASDAGEQPAAAYTPLSPEMREVAQLIAAAEHDLARLRLQRTLSRNPDDGHALFLYGLTFHREMRYAQARANFERAIELAPGYHPAYHFYGYCLYNLGELEGARHSFETHLAHVPDEGDSHFGIGLIDLDENDLEAAERRFLRAVELEMQAGRVDGVAKSRARLGEAYQRQGRLEEAREQLHTATTLNPDLYEAFFMLYRVLIRLGDDEAAEQAFAQHEAAQQRVRPDPPPGP